MHFLHTIVPPADPTLLNGVVRTYFNTIRSSCPVTLSWGWESELAFFDDSDGEIIGYSAATPGAAVTGDQSTAYPAPAGAAVTWNTSTVVRGRRLKGRSFIVPMAQAAFDSSGTLSSATVTNHLAAGAALIAGAAALSSPLVVWSRPGPEEDPFPGTHGVVTGVTVRDKVAVLRSRRD